REPGRSGDPDPARRAGAEVPGAGRLDRRGAAARLRGAGAVGTGAGVGDRLREGVPRDGDRVRVHAAAAARVPEGPGGGRRGGALDDAESQAPLEDASPEDVAERLDAFGAVLVPAGARDAFRGDLSPTAIM